MSRNKRCCVRKEILRNFNRNSTRCMLFNRKLQTKRKLSLIRPSKSVRLKRAQTGAVSFQRLFQWIHRPNTSRDSRVSTTIHVPLPAPRGAPFAEPQACAPSMPMLLIPKSMFVSVVLMFNASARAYGRSDGKPEDLRCNLQRR